MGVLGVDLVNLRRRRNAEGERAREGEVSRVRRLGGGQGDRGFGGTKSRRGRGNARWPEPGAAVQHGRYKSRDWPWQGLAFAAAATQWGR